MTTATLQTKQTTRARSITLDSWKKLLVLTQEPDRDGRTMWMIRLSLGELSRWRYSFETEQVARDAFATLVPFVEDKLREMCCQATWQVNCHAYEEY
jgi:hypothetical protein